MKAMLTALLLGLTVGLSAGMPEAQAAYKKGNEAFRLRDYAGAIEYYKEVLSQEPSYSDYLDRPMGQAYLGVQDEGKALYHLNRALERNPEDAKLAAQVKALEARDVLPDSSGVQLTLSGEKVRRHHIYLNTGDIARSTMSLGYEFGLATHTTGLVDGVFGNRTDNNTSYTTYGGGLGLHFWPKRLDGFFAGPKANFQVAELQYTRSVWNGSTYVDTREKIALSRSAIGAEAGYQWLYKSGVTLAFGFGYFYSQISGGDPNATYSRYYYSNGSSSATEANMLLTLGYAF